MTEIMMLAATAVLSLGLAIVSVATQIARFGGPMVRSNHENYPVLVGRDASPVRTPA